MDERGADAGNLVRAHRRADAAAADRDAAIDAARHHRVGEWDYEVGIVVVGIGAVRAKVDHLVSRCAQLSDQRFLQCEPTVIGRYADAHAGCLLGSRGPAGIVPSTGRRYLFGDLRWSPRAELVRTTGALAFSMGSKMRHASSM